MSAEQPHSPAPRGGEQPMPGRCGSKLRRSKPPRYCKQWPAAGRKRCKLHGGKSPRGPESPHFKTGKHSILFREKKLQARFTAALANPKLLDLREDIALLETIKGTLVEANGVDKARQLMRVVDQKRKAVDTLTRLERDPGHSFPATEVFQLVNRLIALFLDIGPNKTQATKFIDGVRQLVGPTDVIDIHAAPQD